MFLINVSKLELTQGLHAYLKVSISDVFCNYFNFTVAMSMPLLNQIVSISVEYITQHKHKRSLRLRNNIRIRPEVKNKSMTSSHTSPSVSRRFITRMQYIYTQFYVPYVIENVIEYVIENNNIISKVNQSVRVELPITEIKNI